MEAKAIRLSQPRPKLTMARKRDEHSANVGSPGDTKPKQQKSAATKRDRQEEGTEHSLNGHQHSSQKAKGGAFQTLGLLPVLLKGVLRKGFRLPTPIQRKCIPPLLEGLDVVGMARTGSGKTAAFVLPLLQKLRSHSIKVGIRGIILSPSRELAMQTYGVVRDFAKGTDLRTVVLVGGDGLEEQFSQLATNPDILIATPGRLMHVCVETKMSLKEVQFVVWDEADRLMEDPTMARQMHEINARFPETRQTALFSATLPKALAEFAQIGLKNPLLIRLDADSKLSPDLRMSFVHVQSDSKDALLLALLGQVITGRKELTVIFVATKHHVEYLQELLASFNMPCTYIYGALDQMARKLAIEQFRCGKKPILVVTDVAARGIDIPLLDNVINYDFPATPKLFLHRVGRVARAGRTGNAYSLITNDELPFLFDLQLFLGYPINTPSATPDASPTSTLILGNAPQHMVDEEQERIAAKISQSGTLEALKKVMKNACKLYRRTRPAASPESHRRSKEFQQEKNANLGTSPVFRTMAGDQADEHASIVQAIQNYKPKSGHLKLAMPTRPTKALATLLATAAKTPSAPHRDDEHYIKYTKEENKDDRGYSIKGSSFAELAQKAAFDLSTSMVEDPALKRAKGSKKDERSKMVRTEMGTRVPASYRSDTYEKWRSKTHLEIQRPGETECEASSSRAKAVLSAGAERRLWRNKKPNPKRKTK